MKKTGYDFETELGLGPAVEIVIFRSLARMQDRVSYTPVVVNIVPVAFEVISSAGTMERYRQGIIIMIRGGRCLISFITVLVTPQRIF